LGLDGRLSSHAPIFYLPGRKSKSLARLPHRRLRDGQAIVIEDEREEIV
jgi:hypothetical protein